MKCNRKVTLPNGRTEVIASDLRRNLNLNYLRYTNKTRSVGIHDLPALACDTQVLPDFIALYGQPSTYHKTLLTAVGFWEYDNVFDGLHGLYNAIYYDDKKLLKVYRERFKGVRNFFTPDYSQFGDVDDLEEHYRLKKARVVGLWLAVELHAVVIPFITMPTPASIDFALDGLEDCHVAAFSTKGYVGNCSEREILKRMIQLTVDKLNLHSIVVYDVCKDNSAFEDIFSYAYERGIKVVVPNNTLKGRNVLKASGWDAVRTGVANER